MERWREGGMEEAVSKVMSPVTEAMAAPDGGRSNTAAARPDTFSIISRKLYIFFHFFQLEELSN